MLLSLLEMAPMARGRAVYSLPGVVFWYSTRWKKIPLSIISMQCMSFTQLVYVHPQRRTFYLNRRTPNTAAFPHKDLL